MKSVKCKICRRIGEKLFLKGERCFSAKCAMVKRPYPPGHRKNQRRRPPSEYAKELREKQKLRNWYNLREKQFSNYVRKILKKRGKVKNASALLIKRLEFRLDNVIFRMGLASSRTKARQLVSHGFFMVNGKPMNIPSHQVKKGDIISLKPKKNEKKIVKEMKTLAKKQKIHSWLKLDIEKLEGKIVGEPTLEEVVPPVEMQVIFEFYSR